MALSSNGCPTDLGLQFHTFLSLPTNGCSCSGQCRQLSRDAKLFISGVEELQRLVTGNAHRLVSAVEKLQRQRPLVSNADCTDRDLFDVIRLDAAFFEAQKLCRTDFPGARLEYAELGYAGRLAKHCCAHRPREQIAEQSVKEAFDKLRYLRFVLIYGSTLLLNLSSTTASSERRHFWGRPVR